MADSISKNPLIDYMNTRPAYEFSKDLMDLLEKADVSLYGISLKPCNLAKLRRDLLRQGYKF